MSAEQEQAEQAVNENAANGLDSQQTPHEQEAASEEESLLQAEDDLAEQIRQAEQKAEENWELLLRTRAEMENLRRRTEKDLENAHKFALEKFVTELLPVLDSMEMGMAVNEGGEPEETVKALKEGIEMTVNMMKKAFEKFNIEVIDPVNEKFDPELHQAMSTQPSDEVEPNTVIAVMQKGYTLNGRLVRPAMVMVSKAGKAGEKGE